MITNQKIYPNTSDFGKSTVEKIPLVSIGIPTYNRAALLERAVQSLVAQDYPNIEILISDNASEDTTQKICEVMCSHYPFVRSYRNRNNVPALSNFRKVLLLSNGEYFMWAADDDFWEPNFVSVLVEKLEMDPLLVLAAAEAQYVLNDGYKLPFFPEGTHFYEPIKRSKTVRLFGVALHNYGNLIYGVYRRDAMIDSARRRTILDSNSFENEIPVFLQIASKGTIRVVPKIMFYKTTSLITYMQAAREYGFRPNVESIDAKKFKSAIKPADSEDENLGKIPQLNKALERASRIIKGYLYQVKSGLNYHLLTFLDIVRVLPHLDCNVAVKALLTITFVVSFTLHFMKLVFWWKIQDSVRSAPKDKS